MQNVKKATKKTIIRGTQEKCGVKKLPVVYMVIIPIYTTAIWEIAFECLRVIMHDNIGLLGYEIGYDYHEMIYIYIDRYNISDGLCLLR